MIEEYAVDIRTLPAYQQYVAPLLAQVQKDAKAIGRKNYCKYSLVEILADTTRAALEKTWYFIPAHLNELPPSLTGLEFSSDQTALQSDDSVWIDDLEFKNMDLHSQGLMLIHEIAMATARSNSSGNWDSLDDSIRAKIQSDVRRFTITFPKKALSSSVPVLEIYLEDFDFTKVGPCLEPTQWTHEKP